jgi:uncharacterized protein (TIGR02145 family)
LYNWYAVNDSREIAPTGWHIPNDAEWTTLTSYLGGSKIAGIKLKEAGTAHWTYPNFSNNETGFTALPGGFRDHIYGGLFGIGITGNWWCSTEFMADNAFEWQMINDSSNVYRSYYPKKFGFSVRCIKD